MILQNLILLNRICDMEELCFRHRGSVKLREEHLCLEGGSILETDTYFNLFDAGTWEKYTGIRQFQCVSELMGKGIFSLYFYDAGKDMDRLVAEVSFSGKQKQEIIFDFSAKSEGYFFVKIAADEEVEIFRIAFGSRESEKRKVRLGVDICTYRRKEQLERNLETFLNSDFFREGSDLYGKLRICVVDNASELKDEHLPFISLVHNKNTGGSGGFARGIEELKGETGLTYMVFMDDDVEFLPETFYRLYALLSCLSKEYEEYVVAGRMFRMDQRSIQYTAAEIWNGGQIGHVGFQKDMTKKENLTRLNDSTGAEYTGWWFGCFPMDFVRENMPLPFFIHCDDVEYGLRHGGTPIILNGIQVWHETYEYRQSPAMTYYDLRNSYFVNDLYGLWNDEEEPIEHWKKAITKEHLKEDYLNEYMLIQAFLDYTKGIRWLKKIDSGRYHKKLLVSKAGRIKTAVLWRIAEVSYRQKTKAQLETGGTYE